MLPELKTMVEDVNRTLVVEQGTFLSDNVYVYDAKKDMVAVYDGKIKSGENKRGYKKEPRRFCPASPYRGKTS